MTQSAYWPKAFGLSCVIHIVFALLLGLFVGSLPERQTAEKYIVIDLSVLGGGGGGAGGGLTVQPAERPVLPAAPVTSEQPASLTPPQTETIHDFSTEEIVPEALAFHDRRDNSKPVSVRVFGSGSGSGNAAGDGGDGTGPGSAGGSGGGAGSGVGSGTGSGDGSAAGTKVDSAIMAFLAEVEKHKAYPYIARKRGHEGIVTVFVELSADGELQRVKVEQSSGFSQLDEAATAVIRRVSPFYHGLGRSVAMKIPISYQLLP